jgi:P-type conjugative transfer ATPase TrbB
MLRTALGPSIARLGWTTLAVHRGDAESRTAGSGSIGSRGRQRHRRTLSAADGERIVRLVAHHVGAEVHARSPRVSAELPETGERFEGLLPPVVAAPTFAIRKPAVAVFTLDDYVSAGIMYPAQAKLLAPGRREARANILVAGGTSTGKTTLVNALLAEVAKTTDRVVLIEDTRELQCAAPNLVALRTKDGVASLSDLVRSSLRLRPDRIPIGEVRGAEALDLLKAWGTGHPGGIGTIHAGSALGALRRLEQLIQEAVVTVPRALIAETINLIVVLAGRGAARRLTELARVEGLVADRGLRPRVQQFRSFIRRRPPNDPCHRRHGPHRAMLALHGVRRDRADWSGPCRRLQHAVGATAHADPAIIEGPVAKIIAVIIIIVTGLTLAFGDTSGGFRRLIQIVFGLSIAFAASSSFFLSFFSFGGGALI